MNLATSYKIRPYIPSCKLSYFLVDRPDRGREGCIYILRNLKNGKGYVGQALDAERRWQEHIKAALDKDSQYPIHRAIRKYGLKNFSAEVIYTCSEFRLNAEEVRLIVKLKTHVSQGGYNVTWGGDGVRGYKFTTSDKARMSAAALAYFAAHPEARERVRVQSTGRKQSVESRAKRSIAMTGKKRGPSSKGSEAANRRWSNPTYRLNQATAQAQRKLDPEKCDRVSANIAAGARRRYEDPKEREYSGITARSYWSSPGVKSKMSELISAGMQDVIDTPEYRKHLSDGAKRCAARHRREREAALAR
jgi:group I intron endonuclease